MQEPISTDEFDKLSLEEQKKLLIALVSEFPEEHLEELYNEVKKATERDN